MKSVSYAHLDVYKRQTVADEQHVPFGGEKNSGLGRFNGRWILEEMTRTHWTSVQHAPHPYPF